MATVGLPAAGVENDPVWMPRKVASAALLSGGVGGTGSGNHATAAPSSAALPPPTVASTFSPDARSFTFAPQMFPGEGEPSRTGRESCGNETGGGWDIVEPTTNQERRP